MTYTLNNFNENGADSQILQLKLNQIQADAGDFTSESSYVLEKY